MVVWRVDIFMAQSKLGGSTGTRAKKLLDKYRHDGMDEGQRMAR